MKRLLLPLLIVCFAAIGGTAGFLLGGQVYRSPPAPPGVDLLARGQQVPPFTLPDSAGTPQPLAQWRGRLLVLNYWASWCPPCVEEMPMLDRYARTHAERGIAVVGIAEDDPQAVAEFLAEHPVAYPILLGGGMDGSSMRLGNNRGVLPFTALIGPDGALLDHRAGVLDEAALDAWLSSHPAALAAAAP